MVERDCIYLFIYLVLTWTGLPSVQVDPMSWVMIFTLLALPQANTSSRDLNQSESIGHLKVYTIPFSLIAEQAWISKKVS